MKFLPYILALLCLAATPPSPRRTAPSVTPQLYTGIAVNAGADKSMDRSASLAITGTATVNGSTNNVAVSWSYSGPGTLTINNTAARSITVSGVSTTGVYTLRLSAYYGALRALTNGDNMVLTVTNTTASTPPFVALTSITNGQTFSSSALTSPYIIVATNGTPSGLGTLLSPIDLPTAIKRNNPLVTPGTTVYLRGNTTNQAVYSYPTTPLIFDVSGNSSNWVVFDAYPGERHYIDGMIRVSTNSVSPTLGNYIELRNIVVGPRSTTNFTSWAAFAFFGKNFRCINCESFNQPGDAFEWWDTATNGTFYGNIATRSGFYDPTVGQQRWRGHSFYSHNLGPQTNVVEAFDAGQAGDQWQIFSGGSSSPQKFLITNCVSANNGGRYSPLLGTNDSYHSTMTIGARVSGVKDVLVDSCVFFNPPVTFPAVAGPLFGDNTTHQQRSTNITIRNCQFNGGSPAINFFLFDQVVFTNNTINASTNIVINYFTNGITPASNSTVDYNTYRSRANLTPFAYNASRRTFANWQAATGFDAHSTFATGLPTNTVTIKLVPNRYKAGRAMLAIVNWSNTMTISVDLSSVLTVGQVYEIRNNYSRTAVVQGTYDGLPVSVPMTTGADPSSGQFFQRFVVDPIDGPPTGATVPLVATTTPGSAAVSSVAFYNGTTLLSSDVSAPYTYNWTNVAAGSYTVRAIATDALSNKATNTVTIQVN